jgi:hypothetical protein
MVHDTYVRLFDELLLLFLFELHEPVKRYAIRVSEGHMLVTWAAPEQNHHHLRERVCVGGWVWVGMCKRARPVSMDSTVAMRHRQRLGEQTPGLHQHHSNLYL